MPERQLLANFLRPWTYRIHGPWFGRPAVLIRPSFEALNVS
jgi:hypothetical protein